MKPADIFLARTPGAPSLAPDGRRAVVAVRGIDPDADDYTSQLWLVPTDGSGPPRQLTRGWRDDRPRWSPDGAWIAFTRAERGADGKVGKPQLWVLPVAGGEPLRLTDHPLGAGAGAWSPDSTRLAYQARVPEEGRYGTADGIGPEKEPPRRITTYLYRLDGLGFTNDRRAHVWVVDLAGESHQVTHGDFDHGEPDWSPAGDLLTFAASRHEGAGDDLRVDVWVCAPDGTGLRALTSGGYDSRLPRFSRDGALVCFTGAETGPDGRHGLDRNEPLYAVPVTGGDVAVLTDPAAHTMAYPNGVITPVDDGVLYPTEQRGAVHLLRVPYAGGVPEVVLAGARQATAADERGGTLVSTVADPTSWGELVGPGGTLTDFNADFRAAVDIRPQEEIIGRAPDGYPVHGWLVRPAGEGPHPVLLMIHGGPFTQYGWTLFDEAQVYAGAGYAVVMGNPRGSSGYGLDHRKAIMGNVGEVSATDLLALLDAALTDPALDGTRVGVLGGSHGGFMTTWLAAKHGDRFKAAISERSVNAIDSFVGSSDIGWVFADDLYGPTAEAQHRQSPLTYVDGIRIPMLIIHSEQDWRCPLEQAQRLYVALRKRGVPTELLLFPGEGHELTRSGLPSHRVARFEAVLDWWSRHL